MKKQVRSVATGISAVAITALLAGCASNTDQSSRSEVPSILSEEQCQPTFRDRPGTEIVKFGIAGFRTGIDQSTSIDDQFVLTARFSPDQDWKGRVAKRIPFERVMESAYISGVEITTKETGDDKGPVVTTSMDTSMFAVGIGGFIEVEKATDEYLVRLNYRDAVLKGIYDVTIKGDDGEQYTVQSPEIANRSQDIHQTFSPDPGIYSEVHPGAADRQLLIQRCWFKVSESS